MAWMLLAVLAVLALLAPWIGTDSRDGHDWSAHHLWPYPGGDDPAGDRWNRRPLGRTSSDSSQGRRVTVPSPGGPARTL